MSRFQDHLDDLIHRHPSLLPCIDDISTLAKEMIRSLEQDRFVWICGNGGSAADADHIAGELVKSFCIRRRVNETWASALRDKYGEEGEYLAEHLEPGLRVIPLTGMVSLTSAVANDTGKGDLGFAQQVLAFGQDGDLLLGISTSGNSASVAHALRVARLKKIVTAGLTGETGGQMKRLCDVMVKVPSQTTHVVQEMHLPVYHTLCLIVEDHFYGGNSSLSLPR